MSIASHSTQPKSIDDTFGLETYSGLYFYQNNSRMFNKLNFSTRVLIKSLNFNFLSRMPDPDGPNDPDGTGNPVPDEDGNDETNTPPPGSGT